MKQTIEGGLDLHGMSSEFKLNFILSVRNLEGFKSVTFEDGPDDIAEWPADKVQSQYWFEFDLFGNKYSSQDLKIPHNKAMKQPLKDGMTSGTSIVEDGFMLDFGFQKTYALDLTEELYRKMMKGFSVEVFHSEPYKKTDEETGEETVHVTTESMGFIMVNLTEFLTDSNMTSIRKKYPLFLDKEMLKYPNAWFPDPEEKKIIDSNHEAILKLKQELEPVQEEETAQQQAGKGKDAKGAKKPDPKKAPAKGKDAKVIEEAPAVQQLEWHECKRKIVAVKGDIFGEKVNKDNLRFFLSSKPVVAVQVTLG